MIRFIVLMTLLLQVACGKTQTTEACSLVDDELSPDPSAELKPDAMVVPYHITSTMNSWVRKSVANYIDIGPPICTPKAVKEKINQLMQLYGSDPKYNIRYEYAGAVPNMVDYSEVPRDGAYYVILGIGQAGGNYGRSPTPIVSGTGYPFAPWGPSGEYDNLGKTPPTVYPGGQGTVMDAFYEYAYMLHELGHGLGLTHIPNASSSLSYEGNVSSEAIASGPEQEFLFYSEQDRTDLIAAAPAAGVTTYAIEGKVKTAEATRLCSVSGTAYDSVQCAPLNVYAVDTVTGRTFSTQSMRGTEIDLTTFNFKINILVPGTYRVFTRTVHHANSAIDPTEQSPSWFVDSTTSTNDPYAGTVITLTETNPKETGIVIPLIEEPSPFIVNSFDFFRITFGQLVDFHPAFLTPGESGLAYINHQKRYSNFAPITSISTYGSSPDVTISELTRVDTIITDTTFNYSVKIAANADALPGARLVLLKAATGNTYATLVGIEVQNAGARKPSYVYEDFEDQLNGKFDFTTLDPTYWQGTNP